MEKVKTVFYSQLIALLTYVAILWILGGELKVPDMTGESLSGLIGVSILFILYCMLVSLY